MNVKSHKPQRKQCFSISRMIFVCMLALITSMNAYAQNKVTGKVIDQSGDPIIGASVLVKGSTNGTITDLEGHFTLNASTGATIVISYIGYKAQEVVAKSGLINVVLKEDSELLDEIVVVGYGSQKKETLTGAVTVVGKKTLQDKGAMSSPLQAMQGQVPGVIITRSSGAPGDESWGMTLRGAVSKNTTPPLVIIDGIEYESVNELRLLNPSDIESINFLKDASAAIYGSKAAGGVVLVVTKKAQSGKAKIEYSGSVTGKVVGLKPTLMTLNEWSDAVITARTNDGYGLDDTWIRYAKLAQANQGRYIDLAHSANPISAFGDVSDFVFMDTNWQDVLFGNTMSTQHELSASGGTEKSLYRLSVGYLYDASTLKWGDNNNKRYNVRLTNQVLLTDKISIESVIAYNRQDQVAPSMLGNVLSQSTAQPGLPAATIDGRPYAWGTWGAPNWYAELGGDNNLKVSAINISELFKYKIRKDLDVVVNVGYNTSTATRDVQKKSIDFYNYAGNKQVYTNPKQANSSYEKSFSRTDYYSASGYLNYHKTFNEKHNVEIMLGTQYNLKEYDYTVVMSQDIQNSLEVINGSGEVALKSSSNKTAEKWHEAMMSYFSRINYNYKSKYLVEANLRYDGSSKFQPENRWDVFYGFSGGWRLTEEPFMQNIPLLNELKIRASYGVVGNQSGISRYDGVQLYNFKSGTGAYLGTGKVSYVDTSGEIASSDRAWERIHNYNLGVDFQLLDSRLVGTAEAFLKKNNNMLLNVTYPGILGDKAPGANVGKFEAKGWEGTLNWQDKIGSVKYHVGGSFTYAENKLINGGGTTVLTSGYVATQEGYALNSIFGLRYCGKIQNEEQLRKYIYQYQATNGIGMPSNLRLGDNMYEDVNNDGRLDEKDYVYLGADDPQMSYSLNFGAEWKGFDISTVFQGVGKRTIWRDAGADSWRVPMRAVYLNTTNSSVGNTWSADNQNAYYPTYTNVGNLNTYNYQASSWAVENGAYLRLKNVTIGYNFPAAWLAQTKTISALRLYISGADLWEKSHVSDGWDPEASRKVENSARYPFNRTYTVGVNVTF